MKKNFYTGIMTGLCGALLIFSILGAVYLFMDTKTDGYNQDDRFESSMTRRMIQMRQIRVHPNNREA